MDRTFKVGDRVQTRDGRKARIICNDRQGSRTVVALVDEDPYVYYADGLRNLGFTSGDDLVPVPRKRTVWVTDFGYAEGRTRFFVNELGSCRAAKLDGALACYKIEVEEGHFDD